MITDLQVDAKSKTVSFRGLAGDKMELLKQKIQNVALEAVGDKFVLMHQLSQLCPLGSKSPCTTTTTTSKLESIYKAHEKWWWFRIFWSCGVKSWVYKCFEISKIRRNNAVQSSDFKFLWYFVTIHSSHTFWNHLRQVVRMQRVQNPYLWRRYANFRKGLRKNNEILAWYGTRATSPTIICGTGVDFRVASSGMWGRGAYFAHNSLYSGSGYAHPLPDGSKCMFICRVDLGELCDLTAKSVKPPTGFDSVKGFTNNSVIYIVYDVSQAYPEYLITFK